MKNFKDLILSIQDDDWLPLSKVTADQEHSSAEQFLVKQGITTEDYKLTHPTVHPSSEKTKLRQLEESIQSFDNSYIKRLKSGFTLILGMLKEIADEDPPPPI